MKRAPAFALIAAFIAALASAQSAAESRWKGLQFLIGNWTAMGGKFSFQPDLNGQILVRKNFSELANGSRHDDLLVVYGNAPDGTARAMYFDSEGHVIRYKVATPSPGRAVFESEGEGVKYRLSYWLERQTLKGKFEVGDRTYLEWGAERSGS